MYRKLVELGGFRIFAGGRRITAVPPMEDSQLQDVVNDAPYALRGVKEVLTHKEPDGMDLSEWQAHVCEHIA